MAKDRSYGGFTRTAFNALTNTVRAGKATEQQETTTAAVNTQPAAVSLIIPEWMSSEDKVKYLTYVKDYLQTQLAIVNNELDSIG